MDCSNAAPLFVVSEYSKNVPHILSGFRQRPIDYREPVVFDIGEAHCLCASREVGSVSPKLINLREVDERSDTGCEQGFYLLFRDTWTPGVFAREEQRGGPVRVWDWTFENRVYRGVLLLLLLLGEQDIDAVLSSGEGSTG